MGRRGKTERVRMTKCLSRGSLRVRWKKKKKGRDRARLLSVPIPLVIAQETLAWSGRPVTCQLLTETWAGGPRFLNRVPACQIAFGLNGWHCRALLNRIERKEMLLFITQNNKEKWGNENIISFEQITGGRARVHEEKHLNIIPSN